MGKSKRTTTSTQTTTPTASPDIQYGLEQARGLFDLLSTREAAPFSTVAPFSPESEAAFGLQTQRALTGNRTVNAAEEALLGLFAPGGAGGLSSGARDYLGSASSGAMSNPFAAQISGGAIDNPFIDQLASGDAGFSDLATPNAAAEYFEPTARGDYVNFDNPLFERGVDAINDQVSSVFERAGRTGSGANQAALAEGVGAFAADFLDNERGRQQSAAGALGSLYGQDRDAATRGLGLDVSNALGAAGLLNSDQFSRAAAGADIFGQDASRALGAINLERGVGDTQATNTLRAAGLAPTFAADDYADTQALANVGAAREGMAQREIADDLYRFNFPYENAIQAGNLLTGQIGALGPLAGSTTDGRTEEVSSPGLMNQILGGLSLVGGLASAGATGGATSASGLGALGSLFGAGGQGAGGSYAPQLQPMRIAPPTYTPTNEFLFG